METNDFRFGEFLLDAREGSLIRDGKPVPLTPKALLLLRTLVQNHGHIVEKERLIEVVWAGSFVEDGNLTFTINLLRKALRDDAHKPKFIETVPRRGYRFIAKVEKRESGGIAESEPALVPGIASRTRVPLMLAAFCLCLLGAAVAFSWYSGFLPGAADSQILISPTAKENLSTDGTVHNAAISADGKFVVYSALIGGKQSLWLRQLDTGSNVEIVPASGDFYGGLALSPDGLFLYFARMARESEGQFDVFRISIFGGIPTKIVSETQGWIDVSGDGEKISFVRCYYLPDENCSLWLANARDGSSETKLAGRQNPFRIGENRFSPDGKSVAFAVGQSQNQSNEFALVAVDIATGTESRLASERFFNIKGIAWLPDRTGLIFTAAKMPSRQYRIWRLETANGNAKPMTSDSESYANLSLDAAGSKLVATKVDQDFRLNVVALKPNGPAPKILSDAFSLDFGKVGQIVFASRSSGNSDIWTIGSDGEERKQLTNDLGDDATPLLSPDGRNVFFSSNRTGEAQIWRMQSDGSQQTLIKTIEGGFPTFVSTDGLWVYYLSGRQRQLRRVSASGDVDEGVIDRSFTRLAFANDGLRAAFLEKVRDKRFLVVMSVPDGKILDKYQAAAGPGRLTGLDWSSDGKHLAYVLSTPDLQKNSVWLMSLETGLPKPVAELGTGELAEQEGFSLSPDGNFFAVGMGRWKHDAVLFQELK